MTPGKQEENSIMVQLSTGEDFHIDVDAHTRTIDALLWRDTRNSFIHIIWTFDCDCTPSNRDSVLAISRPLVQFSGACQSTLYGPIRASKLKCMLQYWSYFWDIFYNVWTLRHLGKDLRECWFQAKLGSARRTSGTLNPQNNVSHKHENVSLEVFLVE